MYVSHTFSTFYGRALISEPCGLTIPSDPDEALAYAFRADREADQAIAEGQFLKAERLSHAALEARCRGTGARA